MKPIHLSSAVLVAALAASSVAPAVAGNTDEVPAPVEIESGNPVSGDPAAIEAGAILYGRWCVQCHGFNADGVSPRWGKWAFDLRLWWKGYEKYVETVAVGKLPRMPSFGEYLDFDQINEIGAFLETLAMKEANWK